RERGTHARARTRRPAAGGENSQRRTARRSRCARLETGRNATRRAASRKQPGAARRCVQSRRSIKALPRGTMRVRMKDIARDLGVSVVTISKVLRNHGDISEETRRRVLNRMRELNYQPNYAAR